MSLANNSRVPCLLQEADWFAEQLLATMPWLKVVVSLRDPISQAIAMHLHNVGHGRP
jgi:hypothetical protein